MARWDASNVIRIGPAGPTIQVRFTLRARFTQAVDGIELLHKGEYQIPVAGADAAAKRAAFMAAIENPINGTPKGILAQIKANHLAEQAKDDTASTSLNMEIDDRDAGAVI